MSCVFNAITGLVVLATNCHCFTSELYPSLNNSLHACVSNVLKHTFAKAQNKNSPIISVYGRNEYCTFDIQVTVHREIFL